MKSTESEKKKKNWENRGTLSQKNGMLLKKNHLIPRKNHLLFALTQWDKIENLQITREDLL